ncbi:FAD-binding oxidoreductase [Streptomyces sp. NBC_00659]|uniref:FAD-binding oxidoreductase n=1 Tax=Streptomyces sp. NBC_00659 TaxID=2903669 RepID=UPI002E36A169|nr:FAD-binding oxidoreductase [Streptomyces sp. NBC_00659]
MTPHPRTDAPWGDQAATSKLAGSVRGPVLAAGDDGYDEERVRYQTFRPHAPALVVGAVDDEDVRLAVEFAAAHGLPVGVQATGHSPALPARTGVLISTRRMNEVRIDPASRTARVGAGVTWQQVVTAAARHGLAPLSGSAPHVGAVAYTLGGGLGLLARRFGYAADHVRQISAVTVDGRLREIDADHEPELFWALRGGRDNFGIVTGMDVGLVPVERLYGGALYFDGSLAEEVMNAWLDWTTGVPEEMTSSLALVPLPDLPSLPPPLRGRYVVHVRIAFLGEAGEGERLVAPLRALGPRLADTVRILPYTESGTIHNDPVPPAGYSGTNAMLSGLDADAVRRVLSLTGPDAPVTSIVEVRQLGGAMGRAPEPANSVGNRNAAYLLAVLNRVTPETADTVQTAHTRLTDTLAPLTTGRSLNFLYGAHATPDQVAMAYSPDDYRRLQRLKAVWDPANLLRHNHNIPPADAPR